ncbi:MAG: helix-turn-helix transcriptional regulator [Puniceicoccales bacterium]|nr:helix-turn-helix transcriptional regulator [Puniceicoccales bacterium]
MRFSEGALLSASSEEHNSLMPAAFRKTRLFKGGFRVIRGLWRRVKTSPRTLLWGGDRVAKRLGSAVREQRKALKLTQEQLAEKAALSTNYVGNIERGEYDMTVAVLNRVASALSTSPSVLLAQAGM